MKESRVEARLHKKVEALGGMTVKMIPTRAGAPDRLVLLPGGVIYLVELKTTKGKTSPIQVWWHNQARQRGTEVVVLHGVEEVDSWVLSLQEEVR